VSNGEDEARGHVGQFDLVAGILIAGEGDDDGRPAFYPNAAQFSEQLVEPFVIEQLRRDGSALRQHVFDGDTDGLRHALQLYDQWARRQAALNRFAGGSWAWCGFSDARTLIFIAEGTILEDFHGRGP
jgi:hypothetical protein